MQISQVEKDRRELAADIVGTRSSTINPRYNERLINVQKAGVNVVVIFRADHGCESAQGIRVVTLKPVFMGAPAKVCWTVEQESWIPTAQDVPTSSGKGHNTVPVPVSDDAQPAHLKRPYSSPAVWWKGWQ